jgi:hypothetical protein
VHQQSRFETSAPRLTRAEADHRKALLGRLKEALAARRIVSALAGRRTLVLRSAQGGPIGPAGGFGAAERPDNPQLYVFAAGDVHIVTTDGEVYWFAGGRAHPVGDPDGAAQACAG